ncbi:hypothetical protein FRC12_010012 [Ceratobasidium sp. 428]|nr:hypothetical protein FRC12_010012 [Ceratobasidium sp. 428]
MSATFGQIPELVQAIFNSADSRTGVSIMLSCKGFFNALAPLVWRTLKGSEILFSLIEGARVSTQYHGPTKVTIDLPDSVSERTLSRLRFYAPYVRHLELCKKSGYGYEVRNWDAIFDFSWSTPLLPNVTTLTLANPTWCARREDAQLPFILLFLSPSLLEFRVTWELRYHVTLLSKPRAEAILYALHERCPNLHTLVLFSDGGSECHVEERRLIPIDFDISSFFQNASLRLLSVSLSAIDSLADLTLISRLEKLSVHYKNSCGSFRALTSPNLKWPNLNQLSVYSVHKFECLRYLWDTPALVGKLEMVVIHFRDQCFPDTSIHNSIELIVPMLARSSPNLKTLWLVRRGIRGSFTYARALTQVMSHLSLREVRLGATRLEDPAYATDVKLYLDGNIFNSLERLEVGRHRVDLRDLRYYVRSFPSLKYLRIQVSMTGDTLDSQSNELPINPHECNLHVCGAVFDGVELELAWATASKFLLHIWPNLSLSLASGIIKEHEGWLPVFRSLKLQSKRRIRAG